MVHHLAMHCIALCKERSRKRDVRAKGLLIVVSELPSARDVAVIRERRSFRAESNRERAFISVSLGLTSNISSWLTAFDRSVAGDFQSPRCIPGIDRTRGIIGRRIIEIVIELRGRIIVHEDVSSSCEVFLSRVSSNVNRV